jgi:hypothetical protein
MGFFRLLWQRASDVQSLSSVFGKPIEWSFMFRVHVLLVGLVVAVLSSNLVSTIRQVGAYIHKIPTGIVAEKKNDTLVITGMRQPFTFHDADFVLNVDTTTSTVTPVASGITIGAHDAYLNTPQSSQHVIWSEEPDFRYTSDQIIAWWNAHESVMVVGFTLLVFVFMLVGKILGSLFMVLLWSALVLLVHRLLKKKVPMFRDLFAMNMVALIGPLFLWTLLSMGGFGGAALIETIAFIIYSGLALHVAQAGQMVEKK